MEALEPVWGTHAGRSAAEFPREALREAVIRQRGSMHVISTTEELASVVEALKQSGIVVTVLPQD